MSVKLVWVATAVVATSLASGCGGSSGVPDSVNGCAIEPSTSCPSADLSGADLSGADLSQATLTNANLQGTDLSDANLTEADLSDAQITDADLSDADLTSTNLTGADITGTNLDGATLCGTIRTDGTVDDTSCPASTETTATTTATTATTETTTTAAVPAEVSSFDVGDLTCGAAGTAPVTVSWTTENATAVEVAVDSFTPAGYGPSGSASVVVPCDGESHQITITPRNDSGPGEPESKEVGD